MSFAVVPDHQVSLAVSSLSLALQDFYNQQIVPRLREQPYPVAGDPLIESRIATDGSMYYQYHDGIVPLVFQYFVQPLPEDPGTGVVYIARALPSAGLTRL